MVLPVWLELVKGGSCNLLSVSGSKAWLVLVLLGWLVPGGVTRPSLLELPTLGTLLYISVWCVLLLELRPEHLRVGVRYPAVKTLVCLRVIFWSCVQYCRFGCTGRCSFLGYCGLMLRVSNVYSV